MQLWTVICAVALALATPTWAQTAPSVETEAAYQLGAGDRVRVTVFGEAELSGEYEIAANGNLAFPLAGEVPASGLTPAQLSAAIAERLRGDYLREPRVASAVIGYRPFYILGEVTRPGTYPYVADLDAMSAVAIAGGYTYRASRGRVYIRRLGESDERAYSLSERVVIGPGDTVRIGERWF